MFRPIANAENRKATVGILQMFTELCVDWSQSLTKRVIQAIKAVYDFTVYVLCEIGKHNYTIQVALCEKFWKLHKYVWDTLYPKFCVSLQERAPLLKRIARVAFYLFVMIYLFHLFFIYLRERFELQGCVLCVDEVKEIIVQQKN